MVTSGAFIRLPGLIPNSAGLSGGELFRRRAAVDSRISRAEALIHSHLHRKLLLHELAGAAGLSVSRMCHLFKKQTGIAPARYARVLRMQRAGELLKTSVLSVKQIGVLLGYDDPSRFVEDFRRTYGLPPMRYRQRLARATAM